MTTALITVGILVLLMLLGGALIVISRAVQGWRHWARTVRAVIHTDSRMLSDAFRLSLDHFQSVNELRKLGGRR